MTRNDFAMTGRSSFMTGNLCAKTGDKNFETWNDFFVTVIDSDIAVIDFDMPVDDFFTTGTIFFEERNQLALKNNKTQGGIMLRNKVLIENALADQEVQKILAGYGYTVDVLKEAQTKLKTLEDAIAIQAQELGQQKAATEAVDKAWENAKEVYVKTLTLARVAFKNSVEAQTALKLTGERKSSLSGWLEQVKVFYYQLMTNAELTQALARYGYSGNTLIEERRVIDELETLKVTQEKEKGDAQRATQVRDELLDEVNEWCSDFREVAKVAFSKDKQQLDKLGILTLNAPRAKKKTANPAPEQATTATAAQA